MISKISFANVSFKSRVDILSKAHKIISRMSPEESLNNSVLDHLMKYMNCLDIADLSKEEKAIRLKINRIRYSNSKIVAHNVEGKLKLGIPIDSAEESALRKYDEMRQLVIESTKKNMRNLKKENIIF